MERKIYITKTGEEFSYLASDIKKSKWPSNNSTSPSKAGISHWPSKPNLPNQQSRSRTQCHIGSWPNEGETILDIWVEYISMGIVLVTLELWVSLRKSTSKHAKQTLACKGFPNNHYSKCTTPSVCSTVAVRDVMMFWTKVIATCEVDSRIA